MVASLTASRLSLASTARANVLKLISKLESVVSQIPSPIGHTHAGSSSGRVTDVESEDEDPTELFHRDIGVQTSLPSTPVSRSSSPTGRPHNTVAEQASRLSSLKSSIEGVIEDSTSEGYDHQELEATIGILREYCDGLSYVTPTSNYGTYGYSARKEETDDEIARVKASIRGVKGVLLSAKSFPRASAR